MANEATFYDIKGLTITSLSEQEAEVNVRLNKQLYTITPMRAFYDSTGEKIVRRQWGFKHERDYKNYEPGQTFRLVKKQGKWIYK